MKIKGFLKDSMPNLYNYYSHLNRLRIIKTAEKYKGFTESEMISAIEKIYLKRIGTTINWTNPKRYTEKIQCDKVYNRNRIKTILSDKYAVREWVKNRIGEEYLIPLLGVWENVDQIRFEALPKQFVLKTNHGSGSVIIVKDRLTLDVREVKRKLADWMKTDFGYTTCFETHYSGIKRKIIAEKYLETASGELQDYKFLCFNGAPVFCWVDLGRFKKHTRTVFDLNWNLQPWTQADYGIASVPIPKPANFEKMIKIATILCEGFSHVRVDLYNVDGEIYFGEMTFTNGSGLDPIVPDEYDEELGAYWDYRIETTRESDYITEIK